jgi:RNA polymerase sigma factor (sigma-70 family)
MQCIPSDPRSTCWLLALAAASDAAGSREALAQLHLPFVRSCLAARFSGTSLASEIDDAVQEVFLDCFRADGALSRLDCHRTSEFRAFLYGVVRKVALRFESRARQLLVDPDTLTELPARDHSVSRLLDQDWARDRIHEAARRHRQRARAGDAAAQLRCDLLQCRFEHDMPIRDFATATGAEQAVLHRQYHRARREFLDCLRAVVASDHPQASRSQLDGHCRMLLEVLA